MTKVFRSNDKKKIRNLLGSLDNSAIFIRRSSLAKTKRNNFVNFKSRTRLELDRAEREGKLDVQ